MSDVGELYMNIRIDEKLCEHCFFCIALCPGGALSYFKGAFEHDLNKCTKCENCQDQCEQGALKVVWK